MSRPCRTARRPARSPWPGSVIGLVLLLSACTGRTTGGAPGASRHPTPPPSPPAPKPVTNGFRLQGTFAGPLPPGTPGQVSVVSSGAPQPGLVRLPVVVDNATSTPVSSIQVAAEAVDDLGGVVTSGRSDDLGPSFVAPGGYAIGFVTLPAGAVPTGASWRFTVTATPVANPDTGHRHDGFIAAAAGSGTSGPRLAGTVQNTFSGSLAAVAVTYACFDLAGRLTDASSVPSAPDSLYAGQQAVFEARLESPCDSFLASAVGSH